MYNCEWLTYAILFGITLCAEIFAELIFAILIIDCENNFRETYKILNNRENLFRKIWWSFN